jgi:hypothetical protein
MGDSNERVVRIDKPGIEKSRALFLKFSGKRIWDEETKLAINGDRIVKDTVIRFSDGYIHGGIDSEGSPQPAIECDDTHTEWWENGVPHREDGPAVVSDFGDWEEYWNHGELLLIRYKEPGPAKGEGP